MKGLRFDIRLTLRRLRTRERPGAGWNPVDHRKGVSEMNKMLVRTALASVTLFGASGARADAPPTPPPPAITVTGSAAIVSQYRFRGLAQSDNKPAVQASITVSHASGFYVATWGSSASAGNSPINIGGTEIDVYGGYTHALGKSGVTVDGGVYGYIYPGAPLGNYYEIYGSLAKNIGPATAKAGVNFAPRQKVFNYNFTSPTHHNVYVYGELGTTIPGTAIILHSHLGHTGGGFDWGKPYFDYVAGAGYKYKALTFDLSLVGTDVSRSDINRGFACAGAPACFEPFHRMSKTVLVGSVTANF